MNKIISKFKKAIMGLSKKYKSYKKPIRILIPTSMLLAIGLVVGVLYYVDYNKSPVLSFANVSSSKTNQTDKSSYVVNGQIDNLRGTELFINGVKVKIDDDGSFSYTLKLTEGKNMVEIKILRNGKEIKNSYTITRTIEKTEDPNTSEAKTEPDTTSGDTTKKTTTNNNTTTKPSTPASPATPVAAKPDYNLNNNYYIAEGSAGFCSINPGEGTMCPVEYRMEPIEFYGIGVTEVSSSDNMYAKVVQYGKSHNVYSPQAGAMSSILTEAKCTAYGISCGRW